MAKPRIIIADTDTNYIIPMQLVFVEEFFEQIDIEIITDKAYFDSLFSQPQGADVLIVSENLYDAALQRHNINHIFIMTEQHEDSYTEELNVSKLYKYTSIKEIFTEIIGKSGLKPLGVVKKGPQMVLVYSAKGGVGKTTVALGMAASLTQNYKKVLYINASWLQSFQLMINNDTSIATTDVYAKLASASGSLYESIKHTLRKEQFTYLPPFKASLMSLGLKFEIYEKIAVSAKQSGDFDYIIVDADSEFDEEKASLISAADQVVIVTTQDAASVYATNLLVSNINGSGTDKFVYVCNAFDKNRENALISSSITPKFTVSEYVEVIPHYDLLKAEQLTEFDGIKKIAFTVL